MKKNILALTFAAFALSATAQTLSITFDTEDYGTIGVYDTWEESPFRTGKLEGNAQVIDNHLTNTSSGISNKTSKILGVQRSRFGSNTFGAKIELPTKVATTETTQYVHVLIYKENTTPVMLVGLGKRESFTDEPTTVEQFWVKSSYTPKSGQWCDMVFPIKTVTGVSIYSLVVVPDLSSPHALTADYACYIDEIEINSSSSQRKGPFESTGGGDSGGGGGDTGGDTEETGDYPISFETTDTNTRTDRYINSCSLLSSSGETLYSYTVPDKLFYHDATSSEIWNVQPGKTYQPVIDYTGTWMHGYVYIDYDQDGQFTPIISSNKNASGSEAVSYSAYNSASENPLYSMTGTAIRGDSRDTYSLPSFTIPSDTKPGIYRMRYKIDWNCIDPAGGDGSNSTNMQSIKSNGGGIIDVLLNIHSDNVTVSGDYRNGEILTTSDSKALVSYSTPFNTAFGLQIVPAPGFDNGNIVVKHGYNLSGEQYVHSNRQWQEITYSASEFAADNTFTIPAAVVDGDMKITGNFTQKVYADYSDMEAMPDSYGKMNVNLERTFSTTSYNTLVLPFALTEAQLKTAFGDDVKIYRYDNSDGDGKLYFNSIDELEPNEPVLMKTTSEAGTFKFDGVTVVKGTPVKEGTDFNFVGNYDGAITIPSGSYFLNNNKFYKSAGKSYLKSYRAYFSPVGTNSRPLELAIDGVPTGIDKIMIDDGTQAEVYTTDGVQVPQNAKLQRGVYITGGKKVYTK